MSKSIPTALYPLRGGGFSYLLLSMIAATAVTWAILSSTATYANPTPWHQQILFQALLAFAAFVWLVPPMLAAVRQTLTDDGPPALLPLLRNPGEKVLEAVFVAMVLLLLLGAIFLLRLAMSPLIDANEQPEMLALVAPALILTLYVLASLGTLAIGAAGTYNEPPMAFRLDRHLRAYVFTFGHILLTQLHLAILAVLVLVTLIIILWTTAMFVPNIVMLLAGAFCGASLAYMALAQGRLLGKLFRAHRARLDSIYLRDDEDATTRELLGLPT